MAHEASISAVVRLWETSKIESTGDGDLMFGCAPCCPPAAAGSLEVPPLTSVEFPSARLSAASRACRHTVGAGAAVLVVVVRGLGALSDRPASAKDSRHGREDVGAGGVGLSVLGDGRTRELACCLRGR